MNLNLRIINIHEQRVTTLGDWWENQDGSFEIRITKMDDWRHMFCVLIHELTEWAICQQLAIETSACDDFDFLWEKEINEGIQPILLEAGFDKRCPYRRGHIWGFRMERLFCWLLGVSWKDYGLACDQMIESYARP